MEQAPREEGRGGGDAAGGAKGEEAPGGWGPCMRGLDYLPEMCRLCPKGPGGAGRPSCCTLGPMIRKSQILSPTP